MNNTMLLAGLKSGELDLGIGRMSDPELMTASTMNCCSWNP
jgi:hypothetical protein